jgi:hypothetical protein
MNITLKIKQIANLPVYEFGDDFVQYFVLDEDRCQLVENSELLERHDKVVLHALRLGSKHLTELVDLSEEDIIEFAKEEMGEDEYTKFADVVIKESGLEYLFVTNDEKLSDEIDGDNLTDEQLNSELGEFTNT